MSQQDQDTFGQKNGQIIQKVRSEKAIKKWAEERPKLYAAREQRGIYFFRDDDPDHEEIVNNAKRKLEMRGVSDALQSHSTSRSKRFKLGATLCQ